MLDRISADVLGRLSVDERVGSAMLVVAEVQESWLDHLTVSFQADDDANSAADSITLTSPFV